MKQPIKEKKHFTKLKLRKEQIERVWQEHPEAMIQFLGGALIFLGTTIGLIGKIATSGLCDNTETFYITDGETVYSLDAKIEKSMSV